LKRKTIKAIIIAAAILAVNAAFFFLFAQKAPAQATSLRVLISDGMKPSMEELIPQIERSIGRTLAPHFDSSKTLEENVQGGEGFDAAILSSEVIDDLIKQGKIVPGTRTDIARTGIGVGVRSGAAKPDVSTPEALKQTLLNAKSIAFNPIGASSVHIREMLERLGIAESVKSKLILDPGPGKPQINVAEGKAELVVTLIPEIKFFPGVELVGPLPADLQSYINFAAGVATNTQNAEASKALLQFITTPAAAATLKAKGVEPR
jgi:molybdate transport system substrate-binding protein